MNGDLDIVWAHHLTSPKVTVHEVDWERKRVRNTVIGTTEETPTRCGMRYVAADHYDSDRKLIRYEDSGAYLLARHAVAMGARFCKRCWPEGAT